MWVTALGSFHSFVISVFVAIRYTALSTAALCFLNLHILADRCAMYDVAIRISPYQYDPVFRPDYCYHEKIGFRHKSRSSQPTVAFQIER